MLPQVDVSHSATFADLYTFIGISDINTASSMLAALPYLLSNLVLGFVSFRDVIPFFHIVYPMQIFLNKYDSISLTAPVSNTCTTVTELI